MHGNSLIFSRSQTGRSYRVDPLLFPQYTILNGYFLPDEHELPRHGLITQMLPFDFGFNDPTLVIAPYDQAQVSLTPANNFLAEVITGVSDVLGVTDPPAAGSLINVQSSPAYLINFQHTHRGVMRQWMNKNVTNLEAVGTAREPLLFKSPALIPAGDTLTCVVQNLNNAQLRVQILLLGGSFE